MSGNCAQAIRSSARAVTGIVPVLNAVDLLRRSLAEARERGVPIRLADVGRSMAGCTISIEFLQRRGSAVPALSTDIEAVVLGEAGPGMSGAPSVRSLRATGARISSTVAFIREQGVEVIFRQANESTTITSANLADGCIQLGS